MRKILTGDNILSIIEDDIKDARFNSIHQPKRINVYLNPKTLLMIMRSKFKNAELSSSSIFEKTVGEAGDYCTLTFVACFWINEYEYDFSHF